MVKARPRNPESRPRNQILNSNHKCNFMRMGGKANRYRVAFFILRQMREAFMRHYTQLTEGQRYQIYALGKVGLSQKEVAREVGVAPSTISRELRRNRGLRGYRPKQAHRKALRRHREKPKALKMGEEQIGYIRGKILLEWSPEQISGRMEQDGVKRVSHESIYRYLLKDRHNGGTLYTHLRHKNKKYRKRYGSHDRRGEIVGRIGIEERPEVVDKRERTGDFEIDTVIGKNHKQALVTIVDRRAKLTLMRRVTNKRADLVGQAAIDLLLPIAGQVHTITADNGKEFAAHKSIARQLDADFYFAHPYASWERGTNENTNGLIRQYFPKGTRFEEITDEMFQAVQDKLNNRPRKSLGFRTPNEVFFGKITKGSAA